MMKLEGIRQVDTGRRWMGRLPGGSDLIASIVAFCEGAGIRTAVFSVLGTAASYTIGAYDPAQQVYVTENEEAPFDIVACSGNVSTGAASLAVRAHICLADIRGRVVAGRLFAETLVREAEIDILEFTGPAFDRHYDPSLGLDLWPQSRLMHGNQINGQRTADHKRK